MTRSASANPRTRIFLPVPRHPHKVVLRLLNRMRGFVELPRRPAYRRTPNLALTPALPGRNLSLK